MRRYWDLMREMLLACGSEDIQQNTDFIVKLQAAVVFPSPWPSPTRGEGTE